MSIPRTRSGRVRSTSRPVSISSPSCARTSRRRCANFEKGATFATDVRDKGYGLVVSLDVPGTDPIQLHEPRHEVAYRLERNELGTARRPSMSVPKRPAEAQSSGRGGASVSECAARRCVRILRTVLAIGQCFCIMSRRRVAVRNHSTAREAAMSQVRAHNFSMSLDRFGTGFGVTFDAPSGYAAARGVRRTRRSGMFRRAHSSTRDQAAGK